MTSTTIKALAQSLCLSQGDTSQVARYYTDVVDELGKSTNPPIAASAALSIVSGIISYSFPAAAIRLIAIFSNARSLSPCTLAELEAYSATWRADTGDALSWALEPVDDLDAREFMLYPEPDANKTGKTIYSSNRTTDIIEWIGVAIAFRVLAKEFAYPSNHEDRVFADACLTMSDILMKSAGY